MARKGSGFEDKFLSKIGKIDPRRIREFLLQLLSRKNFFATVFDHLTEGIIVTDEQMRVIYVNRRGRELLGWREHPDIFGEDLAARCPPGGLRDTLEAMRRKPRAISGYGCPLGREDGLRLLLTAIPVREQGRADGIEGPLGGAMWVFILSDDTERQRHLEAQSRAQRLGSLALLTSGVAHEIKNPLNSINLHAQILAQMAEGGEGDEGEPVEKERVARVARVILDESQRLEDIVNEFIQAARPQRAMMQPRYLNHIIEDLARLFESECAQHGINLEIDLDPELPPEPLDANLMFQALRNLVRNAIDAHAGDEAAGEESGPLPARFVRIRTRIAGDAIALEVADNGPGIGEQVIDKIFDPYYTTKSRGTGLGLMVVNRIIAEHRGQIRVESRRGAGTRFIISLPLDERPVRLLTGPNPAPQEKE